MLDNSRDKVTSEGITLYFEIYFERQEKQNRNISKGDLQKYIVSAFKMLIQAFRLHLSDFKLQTEYFSNFFFHTIYSASGLFHTPNSISINNSYRSDQDLEETIFHELIHLVLNNKFNREKSNSIHLLEGIPTALEWICYKNRSRYEMYVGGRINGTYHDYAVGGYLASQIFKDKKTKTVLSGLLNGNVESFEFLEGELAEIVKDEKKVIANCFLENIDFLLRFKRESLKNPRLDKYYGTCYTNKSFWSPVLIPLTSFYVEKLITQKRTFTISGEGFSNIESEYITQGHYPTMLPELYAKHLRGVDLSESKTFRYF